MAKTYHSVDRTWRQKHKQLYTRLLAKEVWRKGAKNNLKKEGEKYNNSRIETSRYTPYAYACMHLSAFLRCICWRTRTDDVDRVEFSTGVIYTSSVQSKQRSSGDSHSAECRVCHVGRTGQLEPEQPAWARHGGRGDAGPPEDRDGTALLLISAHVKCCTAAAAAITKASERFLCFQGTE